MRIERCNTWQLEKRIRVAWDDANPTERLIGREWYRQAWRECHEVAVALDRDDHVIVGVVAALSPGLRWSRNIHWARELAEAWGEDRAEDLKVPTYSYENVRKALRILAGEDPANVLSGPKVTAFYRLIRDAGENDEDVCVDGHAYALATGWGGNIRKDPFADGLDASKSVKISKPLLRRVREAYRKLARKLGVRPHVLQATTWLVKQRWREEGAA